MSTILSKHMQEISPSAVSVTELKDAILTTENETALLMKNLESDLSEITLLSDAVGLIIETEKGLTDMVNNGVDNETAVAAMGPIITLAVKEIDAVTADDLQVSLESDSGGFIGKVKDIIAKVIKAILDKLESIWHWIKNACSIHTRQTKQLKATIDKMIVDVYHNAWDHEGKHIDVQPSWLVDGKILNGAYTLKAAKEHTEFSGFAIHGVEDFNKKIAMRTAKIKPILDTVQHSNELTADKLSEAVAALRTLTDEVRIDFTGVLIQREREVLTALPLFGINTTVTNDKLVFANYTKEDVKDKDLFLFDKNLVIQILTAFSTALDTRVKLLDLYYRSEKEASKFEELFAGFEKQLVKISGLSEEEISASDIHSLTKALSSYASTHLHAVQAKWHSVLSAPFLRSIGHGVSLLDAMTTLALVKEK